MRRAARAIVIHDNNLLVMHRNKFGTEYYTLPGGEIEMGEAPQQTAIREVAEEASQTVNNPRLVFLEHADPLYGDQYIYVCDYVSGGTPTLAAGVTEQLIHNMGQNLYQPAWLPLDDLESVPFLSDELKREILYATTHGWPQEVKEFTGTRRV